jgi:hypothetical protein
VISIDFDYGLILGVMQQTAGHCNALEKILAMARGLAAQ